MNKTTIALFIIGCVVLGCASLYVDPQASMDAAYYHIMANQLEKGKGFTEPVIWHYLNKYNSLEHPVDYWMPLGIVLYYLTRFLTGAGGEVWLNIFIWAFLAVLIYQNVLSLTQSRFCAGVSFCIHILCGRNMFYLLTTDNIAFSAVLGYCYFGLLAAKESKWYLTAVSGGLIALLRIEGVIFAALGGLIEFYKTRRLKVLFLYICLVLLVLAPWVIRNMQVLKTPWSTNSKAIFLRSYSELFNEEFLGTLENYLALGYKEILSQKLNGLWVSLLNLIVVPAQFVFFPVWLPGLVFLWKRGSKGFTLFFVLLFWLLCGLVFTHQAEKGTAMHISAFFYPCYAILSGLGLFALIEQAQKRKRIYRFVGVFMVLWTFAMSAASIKILASNYALSNSPYIELFKTFSPDHGDKIASAYPVYVNFLTGCQGVTASKYNSAGPAFIAKKYGCNLIVTDERSSHPSKPSLDEWQIVGSHSVLVLYRLK